MRPVASRPFVGRCPTVLGHTTFAITIDTNLHVIPSLRIEMTPRIASAPLITCGKPRPERRNGVSEPGSPAVADAAPGGRAIPGAAGGDQCAGSPDRPAHPRGPVREQPPPEGRVWVVTDRRYLAQRMPLAVVRWLQAQDVPCTVVTVDGHLVSADRSVSSAPFSGLARGDVVVCRSRHALAPALMEAAAGHGPGISLVPAAGTLATVRDKARSTFLLADRGVPSPPTWVAANLQRLVDLGPGAFPLLCKPHQGDNAQGIVAVGSPSDLDRSGWGGGAVVAQTFVDVGGIDLKIYGIGSRVWGVRRPSPLVNPDVPGQPEPVALTPELVRLARRCADALALDLYGVDVIETPAGPLVVDVNEFPNYTAVEEAPELLGRFLLDRLGGRAP